MAMKLQDQPGAGQDPGKVDGRTGREVAVKALKRSGVRFHNWPLSVPYPRAA